MKKKYVTEIGHKTFVTSEHYNDRKGTLTQ